MSIDDLVEVTLPDDEAFLKIKETLTRIGISSKKEKKLVQTCHILHKRNKYYIIHFKQLFLLDGKVSEFSEEDRGRVNTIAKLLEDWKLLSISDSKKVESPRTSLNKIKIVSFKEKNDWVLASNYTIGFRKS